MTSLVGAVGGISARNGQQLTLTPATAADVASSYRIDTGRVYLDLSSLSDPDALAGRTIDVEVGAGEVVLVLPRGLRTDVTADVDGPGQIDFPDQGTGGFDNHLQGVLGTGTGTVTVDAQITAGHIDVRNP